ncbi:beta-ketoacyl synthase N-terminal-like domain-containing protein [Gramella sp. MAR_2010_147]|uniref:beta-ketoacyl synthase N-terminal-like domain-containing protein n=1 Tax=Gramella sp. MAR_2010_147 TaxID=1250205 RepID=UPI00087B5DCC|nr:beta-ketoacyl synthase N-terminal-like domain-containing protein [Gramella sp. MAR_2010_147]SDR77318.1 3-oxoacyl-[acyl-carrier-protein] synthase-1 [Gramella sp. MAR_2010_147]
MSRNYLLHDSIISPIGFSTEANLKAIRNSESALKLHTNLSVFQNGYYAGLIEQALIDEKFNKIGEPSQYTKLEKLLILAVHQVLDNARSIDFNKTGLIISTTKGNIDQLNKNEFPSDRLYLWKMAEVVGDFFGFKQKPILISNACISGALAIKTANDFIETGRFENAIVAGGDLVSEFVLSGFQSFQAISPEPCRPFSNDRKGVSLGEAAAAVLIGPDKSNNLDKVRYIDAITANDANHISGPSKTGEGLFQSISRLLKRSDIENSEVDYLSAHGTATLYNDEMESHAFHRASLENVPINSFKGYFGHTLGTSALIESILTKHSLLNNELLTSHNFTESGVSKELNIIQKNQQKDLKLALKTASGFGGCNLAMLLKKES